MLNNGNNVVQLGGGTCEFTYTLSDATAQRTFGVTVSGVVQDATGGLLAITGGTGDTIGALGQIELLPVSLGPNNSGGTPSFFREEGDFFLDPFFYLAEATIFLPCN